MLRQIYTQVLYQMIVLLILLYFGPLMFDINYDYLHEPFHYTRELIEEKQLEEPNNPEFTNLAEGDLTRRA